MGYELLTSESTVQVLSPSVVNNVVYCTIRTTPSGAIVSIPVQEKSFNDKTSGVELTNLANATEQIMGLDHVIAGSGVQELDNSGLLVDKVAFTVEYVPTGTTGTSVTAEALVPVGYLNFTDGAIGQASLTNVEAIIDDVYANLQAAAGG